MKRTAYRICSICEAGCGLEVDLDDQSIVGIRANPDDRFSTGHVCAKGIALAELHDDPDRLRTPLIKENGDFREATWEEAWRLICDRLGTVKEQYGADGIGIYVGNPTAHNIGLAWGMGVFASQLGSKNFFSAASVDQLPRQLASELMYGNDMAISVPDILHCDHLVMLGANPYVSNGSLWMVPKVRDKVRALQARGGELTVIDPRLTETARVADRHLYIRPGADAWLLIAVLNGLVAKGYGPSDSPPADGFDQLLSAVAGITTQQASLQCGIAEHDIQALIDALARARRPVLYGRIGTTLQSFGTLTSFLIDAVNILLGAFDRRGGAMFAEEALAKVEDNTPGQHLKFNRYQSRVSGYAEVVGQLPVAAMAEEMATPGNGQIRAFITFAGNPVVSNPDSEALENALKQLDFMVCFDIYHNETTQYADVIMPGTSPFEESHYDSFLGAMGYRNVARYSAPLLQSEAADEWEQCLTLGYCVSQGEVPSAEALKAFEDDVIAGLATAHTADPSSGIFERDVQEIMGAIGPERGVERLLDLGIRAGKWGDHFGRREGLTLQRLADTPHGVDMGEIREQRLGELIRHESGRIDLAPALILKELGRLQAMPPPAEMVMIGRRGTRSNNSWLRNIGSLGKGKDMCALLINTEDANRLGLADGMTAEIHSEAGFVQAIVETTDQMMPGVVSLPHGFSHFKTERQSNLLSGPNYNVLAPLSEIDEPSGTAALNGIPVRVVPV